MTSRIEQLLNDRILVLDGAMGTMIQGHGLGEADFRGPRFADHPLPLAGNNDLLSITQPAVIEGIHRAYLEAGADIVETNTFNSNAPSQADYGLEALVYELNRAGAAVARAAADAFGPDRFVAGILGPTNRTASMSPDVNDPGLRNITFDELAETYADGVRGLLDGGADLLMVETVFDTINAKAAVYAIHRVFAERGRRWPVMISGTITDASGRTLSGQTAEAFALSLMHAEPIAVGFNCALGADQLRPYVAELSRWLPVAVSAHPNAGLPNELGGYDETPEAMAATIATWARDGLLNIVGGCCGTSPEHIRAIAEAVREASPRRPSPPISRPYFTGLEPLRVAEDSLFINVGERANVTGSRRFKRLITEGDEQGAVEVARQQVQGGASVLDVNFDDALIDGVAAMRRYLNTIAAEPDIARLPLMIDSSRPEIIRAGLRCVQGRAIVNSISLKEGEAAFLAAAGEARSLGAAVVVMAFDEQGQADTLPRRIAICERAYKLLTERAGLAPHDIIFDANIFAVGTGIEEHRRYALDFIEAVRWIKKHLPGALTSGGLSNLSFAFRGQNALREAIHAVFLLHATRAGLDMGIVNAGALPVYDDIDPQLVERIEDLLFDRREDATERLLELASAAQGVAKSGPDLSWRELYAAERIQHAMLRGDDQYIESDVAEIFAESGSAIEIIEGPLMAGMNTVGERFGAGKMFLPQVVKSARVMKRAVAWLEPHLRRGADQASRGTVLMATVRGDVHDIGKNIVGVVLECNGYRVVDMGVMVPCDQILDAAEQEQADIIGLSGLITPSLDEMVHVARTMKARGMTTPLMIGGATTSPLHTAIKIAPEYLAMHVRDASRSVAAANALLSDPAGTQAKLEADYAALRRRHQRNQSRRALLTLSEARRRAKRVEEAAPAPRQLGRQMLEPSLEELLPFVDWAPFFHAWQLRGTFPGLLDHPKQGEAARQLWQDGQALLKRIVDGKLLQAKAVFGIWPARASGETITMAHDDGEARFEFLRQQTGETPASLADFIADDGDHMGLFWVTAGHGLDAIVAEFNAVGDDYSALLAKALADRFAEASAEWLHHHVRTKAWGFTAGETLSMSELFAEKYRGIRPAPGYPACPDHRHKRRLQALLRAKEIGGGLTEACAMTPAASVAGFVIAAPEGRYFAVAQIDDEQLSDIAERRGESIENTRRWLAPLLD